MDATARRNSIEQDIFRLVARLRFRHLELLRTLHKCASLRAAAQLLHLTQPALSKSLREVEAAFGCTLFVRGARGLTPTTRGELAIRGANLLLQELAHLQAEIAADPALTMLRVGAPPFVAQGVLPAILKRLLALHPLLRVELAEAGVPQLVQALQGGELDALISSHPAQFSQANAQSLRYEKLFDADFAVIAPVDHALARASRVAWSRLAQASWIMPTASSSLLRRLIDDAFHREGLASPTPIVESTSPSTNIRLVEAGLGLSVVPQTLMREALSAGRVARVRIGSGIHPGPVALIWRDVPDNPRVDMLRDALQGFVFTG